jgi:hypothetical protein
MINREQFVDFRRIQEEDLFRELEEVEDQRREVEERRRDVMERIGNVRGAIHQSLNTILQLRILVMLLVSTLPYLVKVKNYS